MQTRITILFLVLCAGLFAQSTKVGGSGATKIGGSGATKVSPPAATYDFTETFEGSQVDSQAEIGYDNTSWTSSTASNTPRYVTTPAPLAGTYSWLSATSGILSRTITTTGEFHFYCIINLSTATANEVMFELRDAVATTVAGVRLRATSAVRIEQVGVNSANSANGTLAAATTYHLWIDWAKGTGANGTMALYLATTSTKPAVTLSITTGAATTDATSWRFTGPTVGIIDNIVFDYNTTIGSNPVP